MACSLLSLLSLFHLLLLSTFVSPYEIDLDDPDSTKNVLSRIAKKLMVDLYPGNKPGGVTGLFGDPYYWWEAGAVFGGMVDYWHYTGDTTYVNETMQSIIRWAGPNQDFEPPEHDSSLGNDDQAFWALTAMSAAEKKFPNPPKDKPQYLPLVQAVFNRQATRWDDQNCGGGLPWQKNSWHSGYNYKNSVANGCFMFIGARLARYTGNNTYADWAEKAWDWSERVGLINTTNYWIYDGASVQTECQDMNQIRWSYNHAIYMASAAVLYDITKKDIWKTRVDGMLKAAADYFEVGDVMHEPACEPIQSCNIDQRSFKAYLGRWMALTAQMAPWTADIIMPKLRASAVAAAKHCSFGDDGNTCSLRWTIPQFDGFQGVGEQLSALEVIQNTMITKSTAPATEKQGGISIGNPAAGTKVGPLPHTPESTQADIHGARALTAFTVIGLLVFTWWLVVVPDYPLDCAARNEFARVWDELLQQPTTGDWKLEDGFPSVINATGSIHEIVYTV